MLVKVHSSYRNIVAICDSDLLEKTFEERNKQLKITKNFFGGEEKTEKEILEIMQLGSESDYTFNIIGKQSIALALKAGIITKEGIQKIQGIPVALVLL